MSSITSENSSALADELLGSYTKLRAFIARKVEAKQDVEDIAQEAVIRTLEAAKREPLSCASAYSMQVAKSLIYKHWHLRNRQQQHVDIQEEHAVSAELEQSDIDRRQLHSLLMTLDEMPALRRDVFIRRRLYGQSREAIAADLNLSLDAVKKHITRAMVDLAKKR